MILTKKILIAEDELLIAKVIKLFLEKNNFEVKVVNEEKDAIKASFEFKPDLIILDIHLKNKTSGINAGIQIRKNGIDSPIIFTTGNSYEETKKEIKNLENCSLLIKPIDNEQLLKHIEHNLKA